MALVIREGMISIDSSEVQQLEQIEEELAPTAPLAQLLHEVLPALARCEPVHLFPEDTILTTMQAIRMFDFSAEMLEKRLDAGEIPSFMRESQRYITLRDMMAYDSKRQTVRRRGMEKTMRSAVDMGAYS